MITRLFIGSKTQTCCGFECRLSTNAEEKRAIAGQFAICGSVLGLRHQIRGAKADRPLVLE